MSHCIIMIYCTTKYDILLQIATYCIPNCNIIVQQIMTYSITIWDILIYISRHSVSQITTFCITNSDILYKNCDTLNYKL